MLGTVLSALYQPLHASSARAEGVQLPSPCGAVYASASDHAGAGGWLPRTMLVCAPPQGPWVDWWGCQGTERGRHLAEVTLGGQGRTARGTQAFCLPDQDF